MTGRDAARAALENAVTAAEKALDRATSGGEDWLTVLGTARDLTVAAGVYLDTTRPWDGPPLTAREADVLAVLCQPRAGDEDVFRRPPTAAEIAARLGVTGSAVKQHLMRLYEKFHVPPGDPWERRAALASAAQGAGEVTR